MTAQSRDIELFDPRPLLNGHGAGQSRLQLGPEQIIFMQGDAADALFYIERGWIKVSVVAFNGKEAVIALAGGGELFGTRCLIKKYARLGTATTLSDCTIIRVATAAVTRMLREEPDFAEMFAGYLVQQAIRREEDIVDYLTNSSERRLARSLLRFVDDRRGDNSRSVSTRVTQAVLANMIGTTRSRVSFFMNKFRRQGFVEYGRHGQVTVNSELLHDFLAQ